MKTPKLLIFMIAFVMGFCSIIPSKSNAQTTERIKFRFGTRSHPNASGEGCEGDKGICIILNLSANRLAVNNCGVADVIISGNKMTFNIVEDPSPALDSENYLNVYEDKSLDNATAEQLGYSSVIIKKGRYVLNKSKNKLGTAEVTITTR
ncbi:hypothetical protein BH11BAC2_BH11BAC2_01930 [soil metagenome]